MTSQNTGYGSLPSQLGGDYQQQGAYNMQGKTLFTLSFCLPGVQN